MARTISAFAAALFLVSGSPALAAEITFDFDCVITGKKTCSPSEVYGTLTLSDSPGNGDLLLTLDLVGDYDKFRHLMLNFSGSAERLTSLDRQVELDLNDFKLRPYKGKFDVGDDDGKGWSYSGMGPYSTILYGWTDDGSRKPKYTAGRSNVELLLEDFLELDKFGQIYAALYIKDTGPYRCNGNYKGDDDSCEHGNDSIRVGATLRPQSESPTPVPEPASVTLLGVGLAASALWARRRKSTRSDPHS